eukprot:CAMPEP_0185305654 /NCGR_PEP_ID=MMETSP1363-20130426/15556_1 /TAXON_ID=38817 /ORGANISM="Gephyrocapsa oceanica, Strain RCC1303" /LENGTH=191 /DNA_ID=CAMNT_0027902903 /DNA_START=753 /DNA_END=1329 /DNA_ORIENTATION=+
MRGEPGVVHRGLVVVVVLKGALKVLVSTVGRPKLPRVDHVVLSRPVFQILPGKVALEDTDLGSPSRISEARLGHDGQLVAAGNSGQGSQERKVLRELHLSCSAWQPQQQGQRRAQHDREEPTGNTSRRERRDEAAGTLSRVLGGGLEQARAGRSLARREGGAVARDKGGEWAAADASRDLLDGSGCTCERE